MTPKEHLWGALSGVRTSREGRVEEAAWAAAAPLGRRAGLAWLLSGPVLLVLLATPTVTSRGPAARADSPAAITLTLSAAGTVPGRCVDATVAVVPDRPDQSVTIQRWRAGSWEAVTTATLGPGSTISLPLCFGWSEIGILPLRAKWPSDGAVGTGMSSTVQLTVREASWMRRIDSLAAGRSMSVSISDGGLFVYRHRDTVGRAPASNEKLLLSMALLHRLGPDARITTRAAAARVGGGVVRGNLWILGRGDPGITTARVAALARRVRAAGIVRITGHVMGGLGYFAHDWYAPGWQPDFPRVEVALPTALTFNGNTRKRMHIGDPERRAAATLTSRLRAMGVRVDGAPGVGTPRGRVKSIATITSPPVRELLRRMDVASSNFDAEVLGKLLGAQRSGTPGSIAKGAAAIRAFASSNGVGVAAFDSSGLSYSNRVSARGMVLLLRDAVTAPWLDALRAALPHAGEGTLRGRLKGVRIRAKTGTLSNVSALSGWVWITQEGRWAEFSILSHGRPTRLKRIENRIVRTIATHGP